MTVLFSRIAIAAYGQIHTLAINSNTHVDGHYATFVVFLLSDVKKQMEITSHNYKLKKSKVAACFYQNANPLNILIVNSL
jgi:hypothetical protein